MCLKKICTHEKYRVKKYLSPILKYFLGTLKKSDIRQSGIFIEINNFKCLKLFKDSISKKKKYCFSFNLAKGSLNLKDDQR